ncbi:MAG: right-handed parallel beta-helix repeat-containing protein [Planctomycetota bacterium]
MDDYVDARDDTLATAGRTPENALFVVANGPGAGTGTSWESPYVTLQQAIDRINADGIDQFDQIWMAAGTYVPTVRSIPSEPQSVRFELPDGVSIYGGFAGNELRIEDRTFEAGPTILSGDVNNDDLPGFVNRTDNASALLCRFFASKPMVFDGLTLSGVSNGDGTSFLDQTVLEYGGPQCTMRRCRLTDNSNFRGNLVRMRATDINGGTFLVEDVLVDGNQVSEEGLVIGVGTDTVTCVNITLRDNSRDLMTNDSFMLRVAGVHVEVLSCEFSGQVGHGLHGLLVQGDDVLVDECSFTDNEGSGLFLAPTGGLVRSCIFERNGTLAGSALRTSGAPNSPPSLIIEDCTFEHNGNFDGTFSVGAIELEAPARVRSCAFNSNRGSIAGAVSVERGETIIELSTFRDNIAMDGMGAILFNDPQSGFTCVNIDQCVFEGNIGVDGVGGVGGNLDAGTISNSVFRRNSGDIFGAISVRNTVITNVDCIDNTSRSGFGAVSIGSSCVIDRCRLVGNVSENIGALWSSGTGNVVQNSIFSGNVATNGAGAIRVSGLSGTTLRNCTIVRNQMSPGHAAIEVSGSNPTRIENCVLWKNTAGLLVTECSQIMIEPGTDEVTITSCLIDGLDEFRGAGNIEGNPEFVDEFGFDLVPGSIDDQLQPSVVSPLINAGTFPDAYDESALDLDGASRVVACRVDIGAYEFDGPDVPVQDCNGNGVGDACEILFGITDDCDSNSVPDECDIARGDADDCNANGIRDECEVAAGLALDCNANGIPDACDLIDPQDGDCNANAIPDSCDLDPLVEVSAGPFCFDVIPPPFAFDLTFDSIPVSDVIFEFSARGDFGSSGEFLTVSLNDTQLGNLFTIGFDCADRNSIEVVTLTAEEFIAAVPSGLAHFTIQATNVSTVQCAGSNVDVSISFMREPVLFDDDNDGEPDNCEPDPCFADCAPPGGNGVVNIDDLFVVLGDFGQVDSPCDIAPIGGDGVVNITDLLAVLNVFGRCD